MIFLSVALYVQAGLEVWSTCLWLPNTVIKVICYYQLVNTSLINIVVSDKMYWKQDEKKHILPYEIFLAEWKHTICM